MLMVRSARSADHSSFTALAASAGTGFTSLAVSADALAEKLNRSEQAFAGQIADRSDAAYQLMLEDTETGKVLGTAAVKAAVGIKKPYFDFKIMTFAQASKEANRRFDMEAMMLVNDFAGCTEVGSLFVSDAARGRGAGRLMAQSRYMLIGADRSRFGARVVAELRGVVDESGESVFYNHVTRPFFRMTFDEADRMSASTDNQFILDLMPTHPIYLDHLPPGVREVMGKTHPHGVNAKRLLEWEGFEYHRYVDIFDGGPLVDCPVDRIRTVRESRVLTVGAAGGDPVEAMVSTDRLDDFRLVRCEVRLGEDTVALDEGARRVLDLVDGNTARVWVNI
ncbi:MAG TPA: arginine N-succinyltransferase [Oceanicaulis sp.]|uniref:Arginine N-succinyltransferase n=1 Tax=Glycocaulis albus TaxID=1382801 RepID=A0ABQ1Y0V3_9PROT|nr:arginine N-succinyltransferase [Glycocaulis albus]MBV5258018.1 arginine N-succinyltransferase [Synechococcus moorigangaii CMS01]GGH08614.1 arginine N-succinyltransferase [Glycocaulis albus]HCY56916.1 arginine N-succinyltransferase [Oceanicaulis sp.]